MKWSRAKGIATATGCMDVQKKPKLPLLVLGISEEFKDKTTAGQKHCQIKYDLPSQVMVRLFRVTKSYAVLMMQVSQLLGKGTTEPNDTFIPQLVAMEKSSNWCSRPIRVISIEIG